MDICTIVIISILVINSILIISLLSKMSNKGHDLYSDEMKKDLQKAVDDSNETLNKQLVLFISQSNTDIKDTISREMGNLTQRVADYMNQMSARLLDQQKHDSELLNNNIKCYNDKFIEALMDIAKYLEESSAQIKNDVESVRMITTERIPDLLNKRLSEENQSVTNLITGLQDNLINNQNAFRDSVVSHISKMAQDTNNILSQMDKNIDNLKANTKDSLDKINETVSVKVQDILNQRLSQLENTTITKFSELGAGLRDEQQKQMTIVSGEMEKLRKDNNANLDKINDTVNEKIQATLNRRISESFNNVQERLDMVNKGLGEMQSVAGDINILKSTLSNVKTRGNYGELQLEEILDDILIRDQQWKKQYKLNPRKDELVDFAIKVPSSDKENVLWLPIDSKFPLDTFNHLLDALNSGDKVEIDRCEKVFVARIEEEAKSIKSKYIDSRYTTDYAIMFLPSERMYTEVVSRDLLDSIRRGYNVILAGPTIITALLTTFKMGFRSLAIQEKSGDIQKILGEAKTAFGKFGDTLQKSKKHLQNAESAIDALLSDHDKIMNKKLKKIEMLDDQSDTEILLSDFSNDDTLV